MLGGTQETQLYDIELEQALIGASMLDAATAMAALTMIGPAEFYDPMHRRIWTAMADLHADGDAATPLTLAAHLAADRGLNEVGGRDYLLSLARASSLHPNIAEYARLLADLALRRKLDEAALTLHASLPDRGRTPMECAGAMLDAAAFAVDKAARDAGMTPLPEAVGQMLREAENAVNHIAPPAVKTGLSRLDFLTGGFQSGDMVVVAGRPGSGKTVLLGAIALADAREGAPALLFELEMRCGSILQRLVCDIDYERGHPTPLNYARMRAGHLTAEEYARMQRAGETLSRLPLTIFDTAGISVREIGAHAERFAANAKTMGVIVVDYLQIVGPSDRYAGSKVAEVTEISNGLKRLAKRIGWPVVVGCQLNRQLENRAVAERRPQLADLRESGAIEQDADIVIGIHRPGYYVERKRPDGGKRNPAWLEWLAEAEAVKNDLELVVLKNRSGATGLARCFVDIAAAAVRNRRDGYRDDGGGDDGDREEDEG